MFHDPRPLIIVAFCGGFLLFLAALGLAEGKPRPTELQPPPVACPTCPAGHALAADVGPSVVSPEVVELHDLATQAAALDGKRALFRVVIDGPADRQGDRDVHEVPPRGKPQGVLFLPAGTDPDDVLLVEARLVLIRHPVHVVGATATPAFTEYRLVEADPAGP
jgi:hypothetical protein